VEEFRRQFCCETDERVRDITTRFEQQIKAEAGGQLALPGLATVKETAHEGDLRSTVIRDVPQTEGFGPSSAK
jgi:hypothetical protein